MAGKQLSRLTSQDRVLTANDLFDPNERPHGAVMALAETKSLVDHSTQAHIFATKAELDAFVAEQSALSEGERTVKVGDNLYITDTGVPDYWWMGEAPWISELETGAVNVTVEQVLNESRNPVSAKAVYDNVGNVARFYPTNCTHQIGNKLSQVILAGNGAEGDTNLDGGFMAVGSSSAAPNWRCWVSMYQWHGIKAWPDDSGVVDIYSFKRGTDDQIVRRKDLEGLGGSGFDPNVSAIAIGTGAFACGGASAVAIGEYATADGSSTGEGGGVAIGRLAQAAAGAVAAGGHSEYISCGGARADPYSVAVGTSAKACHSAVAVGGRGTAAAEGSVAIGAYATSSGDRSVAVGYGANARYDGTTIIGSGEWNTCYMTLCVANKLAGLSNLGSGTMSTAWLATSYTCDIGYRHGAALGVYAAFGSCFGEHNGGTGIALTFQNADNAPQDTIVIPSCKLKALADGTLGGDTAVEVWKGNVGFGEQDTFIGAKKTADGDGQFQNGYPRLHNHGQDIHEVSGFSRDSYENEDVWSHRFLIPWDLAKANDTSYMAANVKWQGNRNLLQMGDETTFVQPLMPVNEGNTSSVFPYAIPAFEESPVYWSGRIIYNDTQSAVGYEETAKMVSVPWGAMCSAETARGGYSFMVYRRSAQSGLIPSGEDYVTVAVDYSGGGEEIRLTTKGKVDELEARIKTLEDKLAAVGA